MPNLCNRRELVPRVFKFIYKNSNKDEIDLQQGTLEVRKNLPKLSCTAKELKGSVQRDVREVESR